MPRPRHGGRFSGRDRVSLYERHLLGAPAPPQAGKHLVEYHNFGVVGSPCGLHICVPVYICNYPKIEY